MAGPAPLGGDAVNALPLLRARNLSALPGIDHAFTTRHGGVSPAPCDSLNLSITVDDPLKNVRTNQARAVRALGRSPAGWRQLKQVHGNRLVEVTSAPSDAARIPEADAQLTLDPALTLAAFAADCVPLLFAAPEGRAVACAHAGWRGTAANIAGQTAQALAARVSLQTNALWVAVGPGIGPCCFAIGPETAVRLEAAWPEQVALEAVVVEREGKLFGDLWRLNAALLCAAGVARERIEVVRACTFCDPRFFSHRRDRGRTGRQAGLIGLAQ